MRRRNIFIGIAVVILIPIIAVAWWLLAPLLVDEAVEESLPFTVNAAIPQGMTRAEAEQVMAGMAKVDQPVEEVMPAMMMAGSNPSGQTGGGSAPAATAASPDQAEAVQVKTGRLRDADRFHKGSGIGIVYRSPDGSHLLRLEDLQVTNGPALHVLLSPHSDPMSREDLTSAGYVDLGPLKGNIGNQNYPIPDDVDVAAQGSVIIYCMPFHVIFSVAPLEGEG
jgi:hypothetical protein